MTHIALEGGCFVLSANQFCRRKDYPPPPEYEFSGTEQDLTPDSIVCAGGSVIISPSGSVLAGPNYDGEALISADLGKSLLSVYGHLNLNFLWNLCQALVVSFHVVVCRELTKPNMFLNITFVFKLPTRLEENQKL